ncbi:O-antigen ligase family protein [Sphingomonas sanguinis]|nr:O-antigen ligase family protein [Sphingomonas sanguinis]
MAIIVLTLLLILAQTVPLPPDVWHGLSGRETAAAVFAAIGQPQRWFPLSLDPAATRATAFFFLVPLTLFIATLHLDRRGQRLLVMMFAGFGILNALLVTVQAQGYNGLTLYFTTPTRPGTGLFANKNHCAVMLVATMPALIAICQTSLARYSTAARRMACIGTLVFLSLTVFGCLSRAGLALLPIGIVVSLVVMARDGVSRRTVIIGATVFVAILIAAIVILPRTFIVAETLARFNTDSEGRYNFWPDVVAAIRSYSPMGSGLGTFVSVFNAKEALDNVHLTYTNHAHSDYLEIALETGLPGVMMTLAFLSWFAVMAYRRLRENWNGAGMDMILIACTGITLLLVHSALDYPLRTLSLAGAMAVFAAILGSPVEFHSAIPGSNRYGHRVRARRGA